ncbi:MAG: hypothetical protein WHT27_00540 [candidate division WOR-3 bacterium]|jgi:desulfoferrodoxin (superoxide reductase-like protein)
MKKIILIISLTILSIFLFAHGPSKIEITFNDSIDLVYVKVFHSVPSPAAHYIKSIKLFVNGKESIEQKFYKQSTKEFEEAYFLFRNSPTDTLIEVSATCNIMGSKKERFAIKEAKN